MGVRRAILEVDSLVVFNLLAKLPLQETHADFYLIQQCSELLHAADWEIVIRLISCRANMVADNLANISFSLNYNFMTFDVPPGELLSLLEKDLCFAFRVSRMTINNNH